MRLRPIAALALLLALACAAPAFALDADQLRTRLTRDIRAAGGSSGAYAIDLETGRRLVSVRASTPRIPASVEKLFTTAASLLRYGPGQTLETRVVTGGELDEDGELTGDLVLVGGGDPTLDADGLRRLAREVHAAGVDSVTGGVVADESRFDRLRGTPRTGGAPDYDLGGRLGALVIGRGYQSDPALHVGRQFQAALRKLGVDVTRKTRRGTAPATATQSLASLLSPPLALLVQSTLVPSDNFYAETLLKDLGASFGGAGTSSAGAAVVRSTLAPLGLAPRVVDGSGLSRSNRTSPRQVVTLLRRMSDEDVGASWRSSMAVAGRTGTVHDRMRGTRAAGRCAVKTGTLNGVSNLAGYCRTTGGDVAFAWLMNGIDVYRAHRLQDRMTATLARYSG